MDGTNYSLKFSDPIQMNFHLDPGLVHLWRAGEIRFIDTLPSEDLCDHRIRALFEKLSQADFDPAGTLFPLDRLPFDDVRVE